ncbi:hypothetical protein ABE41_008735 [Fictibacillus arsenicus]|uniref:Uncharacterized protein n=1 Tax=Fictibacillus arsenicus TaxID=255247 RepID=A0A1B1Z3W0_9BACL|nr:hypothetical protein [Fictibacillus arsenicus]ANX12091.1 hypothetical protein ABE41_008735 [Fictibacillus arsenicus]
MMKIMKNLQAQAVVVVVVPAPAPAQAIVSLNPAAIKSMNLLRPNMNQVIRKMILVIRIKRQVIRSMNLLPAPAIFTTLGSKQLTCF